MTDVIKLGSWKEPTKICYICACGSCVFSIEVLEMQGEDDYLALRCWGCQQIHSNMKIKEDEEE